MCLTSSSRFIDFCMRKERAAAAARLEPFQCVLDHSARFHLEVVSTPFSDALLDGPFFQSDDEREYPSINLVLSNRAMGIQKRAILRPSAEVKPTSTSSTRGCRDWGRMQ
jgi:hypothetical protein